MAVLRTHAVVSSGNSVSEVSEVGFKGLRDFARPPGLINKPAKHKRTH